MAKIKFLTEFKAFIDRGNAIDMAVGIIVGSAMTSVVNSLVKDVIMPPIGLLIGGVDFSQLFVVLAGGESGVVYSTIEAAQNAGATTINYGVFMNSIVSFLITMFAVFLVVKVVGKTRAKKAITTRACPYCKSTINIEACKCPNCCSDVEPGKVVAAEESELAKGIHDLTKMASGKLAKIKKIAKR